MRFDKFSLGSIQIAGSTYEHDIVIDRGEISERKKKPSKQFRDEFGHTPLSVEENIPWKCRQLVIGTGAYGRLPVMQEVRREAERLRIKLLVLPTIEALKLLEPDPKDTNAIALQATGLQEWFGLLSLVSLRTLLVPQSMSAMS